MSTDTYRGLVQRLGETTAAQVVTVWRSWLDGDLDDEEAVGIIATLIAKANERATVLADLGLAATLTVATRTPVAPQGLTRPAGDVQRLVTAATTLLAVKDLTEERVARLGRSEPLSAAQQARGDGMDRSGLVEGWTRQVSPGACELCQSLAGPVLPTSVHMTHHPGCTCVQRVITTERETA